jgi:3-demethoxyubiquinol 3-hydroxylase
MLIDKFISTFDTALRTVFAEANAARARPDVAIVDAELTDAQKKQAAALMRVNHVGEVCAQALYSGQAVTSRSPHIVQALQHAAAEETDHLAWCEMRINELGGRKSVLNPVWYAGSFALGALAGAMNEKWNLGFLAETEHQVGAHLQSHLDKLDLSDLKTREIVAQMQQDEANHANEAKNLGAAELPAPVKFGMKVASKMMTTTAYYL